MIIQAYTLCAKAFTEHMHIRTMEMDIKGASEMTKKLETCIETLRGLGETFVTFPGASDIIS